jgi:hypothetical protein
MVAKAAEEATEEAEEEEEATEEIEIIKPPIKVTVDVQERAGFTRLVFMTDFGVAIEHEEDHTSDYKSVIVGFAREGFAELEPTRTKKMKHVYDVQVISRLDEGLDIKILIPESSKFRFFTIQKRGILDVFTPEDPAELSNDVFTEKRDFFRQELEELKLLSSDTEKNAKDGENKKEKKDVDLAKKTPKPKAEPVHVDVNIEKNTTEKPATEVLQRAENVPVNSDLGETEITFSSTDNFGMAVFERMGYLWTIADKENMRIPPVVKGDNRELIGKGERVDVAGATAYRFKLPENAYVLPQGGGFIWKIKISGEPYILPSASIRKEFSREGDSKLKLTLKNAQNLLRVTDPLIGDDFAVVTVPRAADRVFKSASFVDLSILPAFSGAVLVPNSDGIRIEATSSDVLISRKDGLNIGPAVLTYKRQNNKNAEKTQSLAKKEVEQGKKSLFGFEKWNKKSDMSYMEEVQSYRSALSKLPKGRKRGQLMRMSEFLISHALPYEAVGYLDLVEDEIRDADIKPEQVPEFKALDAVALIGARRYEEALENLEIASLRNIDEMGFWRALALLGLDRVDEAYDVLPEELNFLKTYPLEFRNRLLFDLCELAMKARDADLLQSLTNQLELQAGSFNNSKKAALNFYKGRLAILNGLPGDVKIMLNRAKEAEDLFFSTRAEVDLIKEQLRNEEITAQSAIPRLERVRFAWRGDEIEAEINRMLGEAYIDNGEEQKGLNILRAASSLMKDKEDREVLSNTMVAAFESIYLDEEKSKKLKPLEAFGIYEEFSELLPSGHNGDKIIMKIVDNLASVELYTRALSLMDEHMEAELSSAKKPLWALKAAALSLLDRKPAQALDYLSSVPQERFTAAADTAKRSMIIKARALADLKRTDEAMALLDSLEDDEDVLRLKADTGWDAGRWNYAAAAFEQLLLGLDLDKNAAIDAANAQLILNAAIAHNLAGNVDELAFVRENYSSTMRGSPLSKSFQVVTRPVREAVLSDRQTVMSHVFEADLFDKSLTDMSAFDANDTTLAPEDSDG